MVGSAAVDGPPATLRNSLLICLTMVSACTDAISYLGLGHVFPANMTGNTVLLGVGLSTADFAAASRSATALGAFVFGAAVIGAALPERPRSNALLAALTAEVVLLGGLCGWWLSSGPAVGEATRYGLIALAGLTMGAQSGLIRAFDVPVTTTYITGTWTALSTRVGRRLGRTVTAAPRNAEDSDVLRAAVVTTYFAAACAAGYAYQHLPAVATALPLTLLLAAVVMTVAGRRGRPAVS